jgi:hypothetical protein
MVTGPSPDTKKAVVELDFSPKKLKFQLGPNKG